MKLIRTIKYHLTELFRKKTKLEKMQKYAEKLSRSRKIRKLDLEPENIMVHNFGQFGFAGRNHAFQNNSITTFEDDNSGNTYTFKVERVGLPYMAVPELKGWWTFRAWLHEIGHIANSHFEEFIKPTYVQEYEAEVYCIKMAKKCKHITSDELELIKDSAYRYLISHMEKHARKTNIDRLHKFKNEVVNFLPKHYKELLELTLEKVRIEKRAEEVNTYYSYMTNDRKRRIEEIKQANKNGRTYPKSGGMFYGG